MIERRSVSAGVTWRDGKRSSVESASIFGHAAVFDRETTIDMGIFAFREKILRGAFAKNIRQDDVRALFNHDPNYVLGRNRNGTLVLAEDSVGLRYEAKPPKTQAAEDVRQLLIGGYVTGSSFAFSDTDDVWDDSELTKGKLPLRRRPAPDGRFGSLASYSTFRP
jgi:HK97 family phage prohead protease